MNLFLIDPITNQPTWILMLLLGVVSALVSSCFLFNIILTLLNRRVLCVCCVPDLNTQEEAINNISSAEEGLLSPIIQEDDPITDNSNLKQTLVFKM